MKTPAALTSFSRDKTPLALITPHWILALAGWLWVFWGTAVLAYGYNTFIASGNDDFLMMPVLIFLGCAVIAGQALITGAIRLIEYHLSYLLITHTHAVTLTGIARHVSALQLADSDIQGVKESLLGRILGYGALDVTSFGGRALARFPIAQPHRVLDLLSRESDASTCTDVGKES
jgi:hypothetical protein